MADLLEDFGTYFSSAGLITFPAFGYDQMPDSPDACVAVYEYAGDSGEQQVAGVLRSIQVVARDLNARQAKAKANALYNALDSEDGIINLTPERWCTVQLQQPPFKMKVDKQTRTYYAFNVAVNTFSD